MSLDVFVWSKQEELKSLRLDRPSISALKARALSAPPARDLIQSLKGRSYLPIIAEVKRTSPSAGSLRKGLDVAQWVRSYGRGGAAAISVLTDRRFFGGSLEDLQRARAAVDLPILRKDFILHPLQLYESRAAGADAVLLIAAALEPNRLRDLYLEAQDLGMTPLVEIHDERELEVVLSLDPPILGINNRDLTTLKVSLETSARLRPLIPKEVMVVGESGIRNARDAAFLVEAGVDALLIGTALMRSRDPAETLRSLGAVRRQPWSG